MAKIVKKSDAPEGSIELVYHGGSIKVDGRGHKTDDLAAIEAAQLHSQYFEVEHDTDDAAAGKELEAVHKERYEVEEAERKRAEKAPAAPAPEKSIPGHAQRTEETAEENSN